MVYPVECFGEVGRGNHSAKWGFSLIKSRGDFCGKGKEGGYGGAAMEEAVLGRGARKSRAKERKDKSFKDFRSRTEEGNRAEGSANVKGFVRLRDGEDKGVFPDGGEIRMGKG